MLRSNHFALAVLAVLLPTSCLVAGPVRAADACDAVYNANIKLLQTPHHGYLTMTHSSEQMHVSDRFKQGTGRALYAGKIETSETIFDGKASYLLHHGTWMRSPVQPQDMLEDACEKLKTHPATCTLVGDQSIDGQAATLYKIHSKEANTEDQEWISKSSGLPVHAKSTRPDGSSSEMRYEFTNVRAPAGVP